MNSPPPSPSRFGYESVRPTTSYNPNYDNRPFIPREYTIVDGYNCVHVLPNSGAYFYRMDEEVSVFYKKNRNTYFGIQPKDIKNAYKTHSHLYVVEPSKPINLIDMGIIENVEKLLSSTLNDDIKTSIHTAFPIVDSRVTRDSRPPEDHGDHVDHDRRVLEYICSIQGIDGYYVNVEGLHAEIGFCKASLDKLKVVDRILVNPQPKKRHSNNTRKISNNYLKTNSPLSKALFSNNKNNNNIPRSPKIQRGLKAPNIGKALIFNNLGGSMRKRRKTHKKRRTPPTPCF